MSDEHAERAELLIESILHQRPRLDQDLFEVDARMWAIHGYIPVDGEVLLAEFDHPETARAVLSQLAAAEDRAGREGGGTTSFASRPPGNQAVGSAGPDVTSTPVVGGQRLPRRVGDRRVTVQVSLTAEEADELRDQAAAAGMSLSQLVSERALSSDRVSVSDRDAERQALLQVQRKLAGAAAQLTSVVNATGQVADVAEAAIAVGRLEGEVSEVLKGLWP
jgi:mobilization protein NikA